MTPLETFFILATFVAHAVTVTTFPLDEEDDGYESDAAQCDDGEEDRDELWDKWESSVKKKKINEGENVAKKVKTC